MAELMYALQQRYNFYTKLCIAEVVLSNFDRRLCAVTKAARRSWQ